MNRLPVWSLYRREKRLAIRVGVFVSDLDYAALVQKIANEKWQSLGQRGRHKPMQDKFKVFLNDHGRFARVGSCMGNWHIKED